MKDAILNLIREKGNGVTFVELQAIDGFVGDRMFLYEPSNICLWSGISAEAVMALKDLLDTKQVDWNITDPLVYLVDGVTWTLPLVEEARRYETPHWLPVAFNLCKN
jgi:hypothetical protein